MPRAGEGQPNREDHHGDHSGNNDGSKRGEVVEGEEDRVRAGYCERDHEQRLDGGVRAIAVGLGESVTPVEEAREDATASGAAEFGRVRLAHGQPPSTSTATAQWVS